MKKGIVALLIGLAVLILVSPGLIGRLAERSIDENIRVGTVENDAVVVSAQVFQRGWFTTEGEHRIEFKEGAFAGQYRALLGLPPDAPLPTLIINTRVDHGVIPVSSMGREDGSLRPGLGDAISTIRIEMPDGERVDVPGVINSSVGFTGSMRSEYTLPAGSVDADSGRLGWGNGRIEIETRPSDNRVRFDAALDELTAPDSAMPLTIRGFSIEGEQTPSRYGFLVGHAETTFDSFDAGGTITGPLRVSFGSRIVDEKLTLDLATEFASPDAASGPSRTVLDLQLSGVDPVAFGRFVRRYQSLVLDADSPDTMSSLLEPELRRVVAGGMSLDVERLDAELLGGRLESSFDVDVEPRDDIDTPWSAVLLATRATGSIRMNDSLVDMLIAMNPEAGAVVGMGYLRQDGDTFVTEIEYAKGILTINGAPMTIPLAAP
jgi:uncharacterized protein YdgA (DUF945 family)